MPQEKDEFEWWLDNDVWLDLFRPVFNEDAAQADRVAKLFHRLLAEIENNGAMGITRVAICLENALYLIFPFTDTYHACRVLFEVSLGDTFPPNLNSTDLLTEAMKRVSAARVSGPIKPKKRRTSRRK